MKKIKSLKKDWVLTKIKRNDIKAAVLAAAHCANACRKFIMYQRSININDTNILLKAIDAAMNFEPYSEKELQEISNAAYLIYLNTFAISCYALDNWVHGNASFSSFYRIYIRSIAAGAAANAASAAASLFCAPANAADHAADAICLASEALLKDREDRKIIKRILKEFFIN